MEMHRFLRVAQILCLTTVFDGPRAIAAETPPTQVAAAADRNAKPAPNSEGGPKQASTGADTPEEALKAFLTAMVNGDPAAIRRAALPNPELPLLWQGNKLTPAQKVLALSLADPSSFRRLKVGDKVHVPGYPDIVLDQTRVNADHQEIVSWSAPLPYSLVKVDGRWKVDASFLVAARSAAAAARERNAAAQRPNWTADAKLLERLGQQTVVGGLSFRPPIDFQEFNLPIPNGQSSAWCSVQGPDGSWATLSVGVIPVGDDTNHSLSSLLDLIVALHEKRHGKDWNRSKAEIGRIDNLVCARARWSGTCLVGAKGLVGRRMKGIVYVIAFGNNFVQVMTQDVVPAAEQSLPVCEASVLTLRRTPESAKGRANSSP
jgi:hypothetical protein